MKMNKFFMLGLAGLAFAACNNEEDLSNQLPEGNGAVTVKLVSPTMTRAIEEGTGDVQTVKVIGDIAITLMDGTTPKTATVTVNENGSLSEPTVTFWNVTEPGLITAVMHGGIKDYSSIAIKGGTPELQTLPASIPVYGEATPTPMNVSKPGVNGENSTNIGAQAGDDQKNFDMYEATISLQIPVARLEVSGLKHVEHQSPATCKFEDLKICGVYLDNVRPGDGGTPTNYRYPEDTNGGSENDALLFDAINGGLTGGDSFTSTGSWPTDADKTNPVFAYNFYAPAENDATITSVDKNVSIAQNPHFKVVFSYTDKSVNPDGVTKYRYAMITAYKNSASDYIVMRKGHIYRIVGATIADDGILPDEEGNATYGVEVTIEEAVWGVETITGEWVEQ